VREELYGYSHSSESVGVTIGESVEGYIVEGNMVLSLGQDQRVL